MSQTDATLLPVGEGPRLIIYHQTHHLPDGGPNVSLLPLITRRTGITHVIIAAVHINEGPGNITLNDDPPDHQRNHALWAEVAWLQGSGVKVLAMLGGAAKGSFERLDGPDADVFEAYYVPLRDVLRRHKLDGIDLDVEEYMSVTGVVRLIDRLRVDFGPKFVITMAPVATALLPSQPHLSGFDYGLLSQMRGHEIAWFNAQFYCGWGDASSTFWYDAIMSVGWAPQKVVMGLITNPCLGAGYVEVSKMRTVLGQLRAKYSGFGGVMGWEYFVALPGGQERPWEWVENMASAIRTESFSAIVSTGAVITAPERTQQPLPLPSLGHPETAVQSLLDLGFSRYSVVAALNKTGGNVERAASLLIDNDS